jgi:hypothetical protein
MLDVVECNKSAQAAGKPYPRTCPLCGLGPCQFVKAAADATEDLSTIKLQPILDLWGDLVRAGGMPALQPAHVEAMARALKRASELWRSV